MKKIFAILTALAMVFTMAAAVAEGTAAEETVVESANPVFYGNIQFNMDMEQVMENVNKPNYEIDQEKTRGTVEFYELEYEHVTAEDGFSADITYLFVGNSLVAIHFDMADGISYDTVKGQLTSTYGKTVPFDATKIGNGKYAIDDDGDLKDCKEMIEAEGVTIILEEDHDGDVDVTFLDPTAAYINN